MPNAPASATLRPTKTLDQGTVLPSKILFSFCTRPDTNSFLCCMISAFLLACVCKPLTKTIMTQGELAAGGFQAGLTGREAGCHRIAKSLRRATPLVDGSGIPSRIVSLNRRSIGGPSPASASYRLMAPAGQGGARRSGSWKALCIMAALSGRSFAAAAAVGSTPQPMEFFEQHIRPTLANECYECHGAKKQKGGLRLDFRDGLLKGGESGPGLVPGEAQKSLLIQAIKHEHAEVRMPKERPKLAALVIANFVAWVNSGAPDPREEPAEATSPADRRWEAKVKGSRDWWSFQPVQDPVVPEVKTAAGSDHAIDRFVLAKLAPRGLQLAPPADKRTLLRRATFDLTGLPPTPEELDTFAADPATNAFAKAVDRLLSSSHYGEHWARHWLDVVRYADTAGDTADYPVGLAWRYRNYVIDAFNADKPYDEFLLEQIAGDILAEQGPHERFAERVTATGFLAISRRFGFDSENYHHLTIQDTLDTLGQTVLGLSVGCARCHDHKFDPISMKDYYALYGVFASSRYAFPGSEQKGKLRAMVPLLPPEESQPRWRAYDERVAALSDRIARQKQPVPSAVFRSLHDPDGDFEIQKDAAGGSYGVIVPPWLCEGKLSVTTAAQSPFKNLYPFGSFGVNIAGGDLDYRLEQTLYPRRTRDTCRVLYVNLDFRLASPVAGVPGRHRFCLGSGPDSPAIELLISSEAVFARASGQLEKLAGLKSYQWHNLQLNLDLEHRTFSGSVGQPGSATIFSDRPFTSRWPGTIDHVALDSQARAGATLPVLEIDNFGAQPTPIAPVSTNSPTLPIAAGEPDPATLDAELQKLMGLDGDFEWQTDGTPPARPWNAGPDSVVKVSAAAQSPFRNIHPAGKLGVQMPNRSEYDGLGLTLAAPWTAARTELLHVTFDFRCGDQTAGGDGSWRYYLGHGAGSSAAVELHFTSSELFSRSGDAHDSIARLRPGGWHQVQLRLNLKEKTYRGTVATPTGSTGFTGSFATGWDGTIDYTFIDSHGHRQGIRPALAADNFAFRESPFPPLDAPALAETDVESESRRARVTELRNQLSGLSGEAAKYTKELTTLLVEGPCEMTYGVVEGTPHNARVQMRGEPDRAGEEVPRGFIKALGGADLPDGTSGSGRLELARWLTRPDNPLTARVMANRIWQYHFGRGLVATPNDFGARGQPPTHPELLDYLAARFVQSGWSMKAMHRLIMSSASYQQGGQGTRGSNQSSVFSLQSSVSSHRASTATGELGGAPPNTDALNTEYSFFQRRRFSAEEIRDAILAISGELDPTPGRGHPFPSPVSSSYTQHGPFSAVYDHDQRSVYLMTQRIKRHPFLALFDGPDPNATTADRRLTTVPTQALYFLNSPFVHEKAARCASRLRTARPDDPQRVELAWRLTIGRAPTGSERSEAAEFLAACRAELLAAGQSDAGSAALAAYVRTLFGSNEFLHLD